MLHLYIEKHNGKLHITGKTIKLYPWEGDSDFEDIDVFVESWEQLLNHLDWTGNFTVISFPDKTEITLADLTILVENGETNFLNDHL